MRFRIGYLDPDDGTQKEEIREFETWVGRATSGGVEIGPILTITAHEWAADFAYSRADKGRYTIEVLKP